MLENKIMEELFYLIIKVKNRSIVNKDRNVDI
jgi:hypothetical protein